MQIELKEGATMLQVAVGPQSISQIESMFLWIVAKPILKQVSHALPIRRGHPVQKLELGLSVGPRSWVAPRHVVKHHFEASLGGTLFGSSSQWLPGPFWWRLVGSRIAPDVRRFLGGRWMPMARAVIASMASAGTNHDP